MFSKPKNGWVEIDFDGYKDVASYSGSVAEHVMEECHNYLSKSDKRFYIEFDAEGYEFGIVLLAGDIYYWTNKLEKGMDVFPIFSGISTDDAILRIAKNMVKSVEDYFKEWVNFESINYNEDELETTKALASWATTLKKDIDFPQRDMELGNLLFGNSRGENAMQRGQWEDAFAEFLDFCGFDSYGHIEDDSLEKYVKTAYGEITKITENGESYVEHTHYFDNDVFLVLPYFWGDSESIADLPNFVFKPTKFEIKWYKYPLRDAYCNKVITFDEFKEMLEQCKKSINK